MTNPRIRTIILDIGRVLVRLNISCAQTGLAKGLSLSPEELWAAIENDPRWQDWQEGRMSPHDWHQNLTTKLGISMGFADFTTVWNSALDPEPIHPNSLFETLGKKYRLGLLSNTDPIHVAKLESAYEFYRYFPAHTRTYSCAVGTSKPNPLIFREALRACNAKAEETVYIDDIPAYAEAAKRLGIHGVQFHSRERLALDLKALGIETES
jgi:FMN phosphatase YigB (HAD superfamily)